MADINQLIHDAVIWLDKCRIGNTDTISHIGFYVDLSLSRVYFVPVLLGYDRPAFVFRAVPDVFENTEFNSFSAENIDEIDRFFADEGVNVLSTLLSRDQCAYTIVIDKDAPDRVRDAMDRFVDNGLWTTMATALPPRGWSHND